MDSVVRSAAHRHAWTCAHRDRTIDGGSRGGRLTARHRIAMGCLRLTGFLGHSRTTRLGFYNGTIYYKMTSPPRLTVCEDHRSTFHTTRQDTTNEVFSQVSSLIPLIHPFSLTSPAGHGMAYRGMRMYVIHAHVRRTDTRPVLCACTTYCSCLRLLPLMKV